MEELINVQLAQKELLENCVINYKKAGKDKRTKKFYQKRLATLQEYWDVFVAGHKAVLTKRIAEKGTQKRFDYFEEDIFSEVEDYFYSSYEMIQDRYEKEFIEDTALDQNQSMTQSSITRNKIECSLQLPKISLEKFDGDYKKWPTFYDLFRTMVHLNDSLGPVQKLQYLKMHLTGEPEHLLRHYQVTEKNYFSAWSTLQERYDNRRVLVGTQLKLLLFQTKVQQESAQGVRNLLDVTSECLHALENLDIPTGEWGPILVFLIVHSLPSETHELWEQEISKMKELPTWNTLKEFLEARFRTLEAINHRKPIQRPQSAGTNSNYVKNKPIAHSLQVTTAPACVLCQGQHQIRKCDNFVKLNQAKRLEIVKSRGLCMNCLGSGHRMNNCPSTRSCFHCKRKHHTLLHKNTDSSQNNNNNNQQRNQSSTSFSTSNQITTNHILSPDSPNFVPSQIIESTTTNATGLQSFVANRTNNHVLLATALVKIVAPSGNQSLVRALIDQGSQASFVSEKIVQQLNLKKESVSATIQGIGKSQVHQIKSRVRFSLEPLNSETTIEIEALVLKTLTSQLPTSKINIQNWQHLNGLELADPKFYQSGPIDVLIGADVFSGIILDGIRKGVPGSPTAQKTIFGWMLSGQIENTRDREITINNFHLCAELNQQLKAFWELEELPIRNHLTEEESQCEEHFEKTTRRLKLGLYELNLPFRPLSNTNHLGKSREIAIRRLHQLENRFQKDAKLKEEYTKCLQEYIDLGHMIPITLNEEDCEIKTPSFTYYNCCYLPHHAVIKESSTTTKLRVVFDASRATTSGLSLNDMLLKGPVVQDELVNILIRWRKHRIAFTADIEKMYRQIHVSHTDAEFQRIVWRTATNEPIKDYKLVTVTFGTKSAPYLATRTLKQLAIDEKSNYPQGAETTLNDFYVDDLLSGADTIAEALEVQSQIINLTNSASLPLRKWASNSEKILKMASTENREVNLPTPSENIETVRTLGISWQPGSDTCTYLLNLDEPPDKWTKRKILSQLAKLFDPLGLLSPIIILAKMLMQRLWLSGSDWDDQVDSEIERDWKKYLQHLPEIHKISIDRWIHYSRNNIGIEIHGFADASTKAYAGVVYICTIDESGNRSTHIVASKTKVAPIKTVSLPRLELCAANLVAKLIQYVVQALKIDQPIRLHAWTDSEIVLAWLQQHPSRWTTFVANRVSNIHELLGKNIWDHVPSKSNPADCASRGTYPSQLHENNLWWYGPEWLKKSKENWPTKKEIPTGEPIYTRTIDNLFAATVNLRLHLQAIHFNSGDSISNSAFSSSDFGSQLINFISSPNGYGSGFGSLLLKCTAQIENFYQESSEIELGGPQRDPIPARVTSSTALRPQNFINQLKQQMQHFSTGYQKGIATYFSLVMIFSTTIIFLINSIHFNCILR